MIGSNREEPSPRGAESSRLVPGHNIQWKSRKDKRPAVPHASLFFPSHDYPRPRRSATSTPHYTKHSSCPFYPSRATLTLTCGIHPFPSLSFFYGHRLHLPPSSPDCMRWPRATPSPWPATSRWPSDRLSLRDGATKHRHLSASYPTTDSQALGPALLREMARGVARLRVPSVARARAPPPKRKRKRAQHRRDRRLRRLGR